MPEASETPDSRASSVHAELSERLGALLELGGPGLLVPEPRLLGGFGFEIDGALYNADTLAFYESLVAMDRGGALGALRHARERPVVWQLGAGWGGFVYQLRSLWPEATYVITDTPERLLPAAAYLRTAFPEARSAVSSGRSEPRWEPGELDFAFLDSAAALPLERVDLAILGTEPRGAPGAELLDAPATARALGCSYLYAAAPGRSFSEPELERLRCAIEACYWLQESPLLPADAAPASSPPRIDVLRSDHLVGWRRTLSAA